MPREMPRDPATDPSMGAGPTSSATAPAETEPVIVRVVALETRAHASVSADVLRRLGGPVEIERVDDAARALARVAAGGVQLVVVGPVETPEAPEVAEVLRALRDSGPPVVVVVPEAGEEASLAAFRMGAADCVRVGPDFHEVLPVVALEQIRRWRRVCERDRAQRHIRWLENLNDAIVSEIPAGLLVVDGNGRVAVLNREFSRAFGIAPSQALGRDATQVLPRELLEDAGIRGVLEGEGILARRRLAEVNAEAERSEQRGRLPRLVRLPCADGEIGVFDVCWQRLDEESRVLFVLSDLTERDALARQVSDLQRYNENIIQNINSALLVVDTSGEIAFANPTAESILGAPPGGVVGRRVWDWFAHAAGAGGEPTQGPLARTLQGGERFRGAETVVTRADGSRVPVGISSTPFVDADGSKLGAVAVFQDLTELKQLQRQVLQNEKMASIGQLAAGVAHEINNPMGFIHANLFQLTEYVTDLRSVWEAVAALQQAVSLGDMEAARVASKSLGAITAEVDMEFVMGDLAKAIQESQEGSERIRHIVKDLREFSHPDTAEPMESDLNACLDSTANIVWTMMKHTVVLEKEYGEIGAVWCFPMQLKQVFMNLLVNAYQSIQERVGGSGEVGCIRIRTRGEGDGVWISVGDTGSGIAPENLARLFDPFFTTKQVGVGTGLGLSTSYSIVRRHGGRIDVESEVGVGSTFRVWLPRDGVQAARGEASA